MKTEWRLSSKNRVVINVAKMQKKKWIPQKSRQSSVASRSKKRKRNRNLSVSEMASDQKSNLNKLRWISCQTKALSCIWKSQTKQYIHTGTPCEQDKEWKGKKCVQRKGVTRQRSMLFKRSFSFVAPFQYILVKARSFHVSFPHYQ